MFPGTKKEFESFQKATSGIRGDVLAAYLMGFIHGMLLGLALLKW